jgi:methylated-DNA-[protein]-cysteine S-methyltransferase
MNLRDTPNPPIPSALHDRLVRRAEREDLLDIAYRSIDTRFGPLLLAATAQGVLRVAFEGEGHDTVLAELAASVSPRVLLAPERLDPAARQIDAFFSGRRIDVDVPIDLRLVRGFRREVLDHLRTIPYGSTETYRQAATAVGKPAAVRAAASACSHNPVPLLIPCHRVVRSDGTPGDYRGGAEMKRALLEMETAA